MSFHGSLQDGVAGRNKSNQLQTEMPGQYLQYVRKNLISSSCCPQLSTQAIRVICTLPVINEPFSNQRQDSYVCHQLNGCYAVTSSSERVFSVSSLSKKLARRSGLFLSCLRTASFFIVL